MLGKSLLWGPGSRHAKALDCERREVRLSRGWIWCIYSRCSFDFLLEQASELCISLLLGVRWSGTMQMVRKEAQKGGLGRVYVLVVRSGLTATCLVPSLHRVANISTIVFCLYCDSVGRRERIDSVLKGRKQPSVGGRGFLLARGTT